MDFLKKTKIKPTLTIVTIHVKKNSLLILIVRCYEVGKSHFLSLLFFSIIEVNEETVFHDVNYFYCAQSIHINFSGMYQEHWHGLDAWIGKTKSSSWLHTD